MFKLTVIGAALAASVLGGETFQNKFAMKNQQAATP